MAFIGFAFLLATNTACKKEPIDNNDNGYPIQLTAEKPNRNIVLNWSETKVSNFLNYVIVRSTNPIPDDPTPTGNIIATIDDYRTISFEDATFPFTEFVYYKVYAKIGDRFLSSPTVKFENNINLIDIQVSRVLYDTENDVVFLFDPNKNNLYQYDYKNGEIKEKLNFPGVFDLRLALGDHGNGKELYVALSGSTDIRIYNAESLDLITTMNVGGNVFSIASGDNDLLYVATDNWQRSFSVYQRSTKLLKSADNNFAGNGDAVMKAVSDDGLTVINVSFNIVVKYKISSQGQILDISNTFLNGNFFGAIQNIPASNDAQFFIPDITGTIMNLDLGVHANLSTNSFLFFSDIIFSENDDRIWGLQANPSEIIEFSFPTVIENKRLPLNYQPVRAIQDSGEIIVVGLVFDGLGGAKTIVDRLQIE